MRLFGGWLHATERLQVEKYERTLRDAEGREYADLVAHNVTGIVEELGEYLKETRWKPWKSPRRDPLLAGRRREELVDVLHFLANLCVLEGFTDATLSDAYLDKVKFNLSRTDHHGELGARGTDEGWDGGPSGLPDPEGDIKADIEKAKAATKTVPCTHLRDFGGAEHEYDIIQVVCNCNSPTSPIYEVCPVHGEKHFT